MNFVDLIRRICGRFRGGHFLYYWLIRMIPTNRERVLKELNNSFFLVTSTGRTGTALFTNLLNECIGVQVEHEPIHREQYWHRLALENPVNSHAYISRFRIKEIFLRKKRGLRYGEVNGALRRHVKDIRCLVPDAPVIHLVRNGYDVVSSIMNRATFTKLDWAYRDMIPHSSIVNKDQWVKFSRFEKICFMWSEENRWLNECCETTVNFEDLINDYTYFNEKFASVLGMEIEESHWRKHVERKINANRVCESANTPENWTEEQHEAFQRICGNEMRKYGYTQ
ncbi:sulfotransferase [Marinobacter sp. M-5]|uniref:sulfotransferase n=1 Tax=Marinobacter sp. M-5 TaxID=3081089 RepID=UPI00293C8F57|nr:sulfotransferase [Marinobacter sp. M-5]MDV3503090.1 sulfotransferase [Marinobacter sp. M-5]